MNSKKLKKNKGLQEGVIVFCGVSLVLLIYIIVSFALRYIKENKFINEVKSLYNVVKKSNVTTSYVDSLSNKLEYDTDLEYFFVLKNEDVIYMFVYNDKYVIELDYDGRIIPEEIIKKPDSITKSDYDNIITYKHRKLSEEKDKINTMIDVEIDVDQNNIINPEEENKTDNSGITYQINKYICTPSTNKSFTQYESGNEYVVNLALGTFSHDGYKVEITKIILNGNNATILIKETYPNAFDSNYAAKITSPCTMVAFNKKPTSIQIMRESTYNLKTNKDRLSYEISDAYKCSIKVGGYIPKVEDDKFIITVSSGSINDFNITGASVSQKSDAVIIYVKEENKKKQKNSKAVYKRYSNILQKYPSSIIYDIKDESTCVDVKFNKIPEEFFVVTEGAPSDLLNIERKK